MSELSQQITEDVLAACKAGAEEAGAAISRAFQSEVQVVHDQNGTYQSHASALELGGPGLLILLRTDRTTAVITFPADAGLIPSWCVKPDATGESLLATLAQELGMNLLPETWLAHEFTARWVADLAAALGQGGIVQDAAVISLTVAQGGKKSPLGVIWPVPKPEELFVEPAAPSAQPKELFGQSLRKERPTLPLSSTDLPPYTRSLLRIKVPVIVTLAEKRQKLSRIIELGPGSIIQFDKSCEEMLELEVSNRAVACGEAVKVGDKFGLRITSMVLPDERFNAMASKQA